MRAETPSRQQRNPSTSRSPRSRKHPARTEGFLLRENMINALCHGEIGRGRGVGEPHIFKSRSRPQSRGTLRRRCATACEASSTHQRCRRTQMKNGFRRLRCRQVVLRLCLSPNSRRRLLPPKVATIVHLPSFFLLCCYL